MRVSVLIAVLTFAATGISNAQGTNTPPLWQTRANAEQGFATEQYNLGAMYAKGNGVLKDEVEAVKWYRKAADQGLAPAQSNLGFMYLKGRGVLKDEAEAVKWYRKAAEQGEAHAQLKLGLKYMNGDGVE